MKDGPYRGLAVEGPEYETIYAFGGLCGVKTLPEILYLNDLCDRLGLDTISAGSAVPMRFAAGAAAERAASPLDAVAVVYRRMGISIVLSVAVFAAWGAGMGLALRWLRAELGLGPGRGAGSSWSRGRFRGRKR